MGTTIEKVHDDGPYRTAYFSCKWLKGNSDWSEKTVEEHGRDVLDTYDAIPPAVILSANIAYLCGEMADADLGDDGFTGWMVRYWNAPDHIRSDLLMECFYAVARVTGHDEYLPPGKRAS